MRPIKFLLLVLFNFVLIQLFAQQKPCEQYEVFRQLDFWVGEWKVQNPDGTHAGHNKIEIILDGCALLENWTSSGASRGKSLNYYNYQTKKWHQQWVDNFGQPLAFEGEVKNDAVYYSGESTDREGKKVFHKLTISKINDHEVKQLWEQSYDQEKWTIAFDGMYIRDHYYFYIDTGCKQCVLNENGEKDNYWILTSAVFNEKLDEEKKDQIWKDFKKYLHKEFDFPEPLLDTVTLRYLPSREIAENSKQKKIEKMKAEGYKIILVDYQ